MKTINLKVGDELKLGFAPLAEETYIVTSIDFEDEYVTLKTKSCMNHWSFNYITNYYIHVRSINGQDVTNCKITIEPEEEETMQEEFEPITPENIREVLKYNGFEYRVGEFYCRKYNSIHMEFRIVDKTYSFDTNVDYRESNRIVHNNLNKVLEFMKEFIELKPLPNAFNPRKFLIDNGFYEDGGDNLLSKNLSVSFYDDIVAISYCPIKPTPENMQIIVEISKLLEKMK